jgi:hypothetical protein
MKLSTLRNVALATIFAAVPDMQASANLVISPTAGYSVTWNGNEGDYGSPNAANTVPDNIALASNGSIAFSDGDLVSPHTTAHLNDGNYGNIYSWISDSDSPSFAGIEFPSVQTVATVAWGRDNGLDDAHGDTPITGGNLTDRSLGLYTLQITLVPGANAATPDASWITIATLNYISNDDAVAGGGFTSYLRHQYTVKTDTLAPVFASAIRIIVPGGGFDAVTGTDIDEIEVFVPEPASFGLGLAGMGLLALARRRRA